MEPKPGSMGKPSAGYVIDILDENGNPCEVGEEGQIVIRTDKSKPIGMFDGYYRILSLQKRYGTMISIIPETWLGAMRMVISGLSQG